MSSSSQPEPVSEENLNQKTFESYDNQQPTMKISLQQPRLHVDGPFPKIRYDFFMWSDILPEDHELRQPQ